MEKSSKVIVERTVAKGPLRPLGAGEILYYEFNQNNSGGRYKLNENTAEAVIIAARDAKEANSRAEDIGIYFDGCSKGYDCDCCGDRWYEISTWSEKGTVEALLYGQKPEVYLQDRFYGSRAVIVHHADGTRETFAHHDDKKL